MQKHTVCIIGNPNCGKTTLFNALTGARQSVGNWPGVTVEKIVGSYRFEGAAYDIVDLPGIYSVTPFSEAGEDERIARDYLLSGQAQAVINIVDASNLERNLFLTTQLIEMRIPMLVVGNMLDVARAAGMQVDLKVLEKRLGCPVIGVVASDADKAARSVKAAVRDFLADPVVPPCRKTVMNVSQEPSRPSQRICAACRCRVPNGWRCRCLRQRPICARGSPKGDSQQSPSI